jgi:hypothetical protein
VLPDGIYFQTKNLNLGKILECLAMEEFAIFMAILSILRPNGILWPFWYIFKSFGTFFPVFVYCAEKNLATLRGAA